MITKIEWVASTFEKGNKMGKRLSFGHCKISMWRRDTNTQGNKGCRFVLFLLSWEKNICGRCSYSNILFSVSFKKKIVKDQPLNDHSWSFS